ncbi:hypothetical protein BH11ARM2_BH11ARM2_26600 [soil metagenome]
MGADARNPQSKENPLHPQDEGAGYEIDGLTAPKRFTGRILSITEFPHAELLARARVYNAPMALLKTLKPIRHAFTVFLALMAATACAQTELAGYHRYPQFRTLGGLPGSGFPLTRYGTVSTRGAMALSTPLAYSLRDGELVFGALSASSSRRPRVSFSGGRGLRSGNGTGQLLYGIGLGNSGNLTASAMILGDTRAPAFNLQYSLPFIDPTVAFAVGVQDVLGNGGASGRDIAGDDDSSTSIYAVATANLCHGTYLSLGSGTRRFCRPFGNASATLLPRVKGYVEYDAFAWNVGAAYLIPLGAQTRSSLTLQTGLIAGKTLAISANLAF